MESGVLLVDSALRLWNTTLDRASKHFGGLSEEQLRQPIAPGKNRPIYLWGHLTAVSDALLPLLGIGDRLHPELDAIYLSNPDGPAAENLSGKEMQRIWDEVNARLSAGFAKFTAEDWVARHTAVSAEDFAREPHRNRFTILLGRTNHMSYHLGQAALVKRGS
jgi:DinB superfamily